MVGSNEIRQWLSCLGSLEEQMKAILPIIIGIMSAFSYKHLVVSGVFYTLSHLIQTRRSQLLIFIPIFQIMNLRLPLLMLFTVPFHMAYWEGFIYARLMMLLILLLLMHYMCTFLPTASLSLPCLP